MFPTSARMFCLCYLQLFMYDTTHHLMLAMSQASSSVYAVSYINDTVPAKTCH